MIENTPLIENTPSMAGDHLFPLGQVVLTPGVLDTLNLADVMPESLLDRHASGDWGELCEDDREMNAEADRSMTTLLLPQQY